MENKNKKNRRNTKNSKNTRPDKGGRNYRKPEMKEEKLLNLPVKLGQVYEIKIESLGSSAEGVGRVQSGGYSSHFKTKGGMPMTMLRLNLIKGLGPVLQIAEGWSVELPDDVHEMLDKRTDPTWPTTWFAPRLDPSKDAFKDVYSVMNNWGANHGAITYGHVGADLITMAAMLRIPVCMHNIKDEDIFRPACWNAFGMDKEGADYRACENFGPLYK